MSLTLSEVEHIAALARLELSAEEKERYREQLSAILDYAARLQTLDTEGVQPATSAAGDAQEETPLRPDIAGPTLSPEELLKNAPQSDQDQFRVPPVLE